MVKPEAKTCTLFVALLLNKLNSDVARFTTKESNLSCSKKGGIVMQKVESSYTYCNRICSCCAFYRPTANLFCNKWRKSRVWRDSRAILSNQKSVFTQLATTWFVARQILKRATSFFNTFCINVAKKRLHVFVARSTETLMYNLITKSVRMFLTVLVSR